MGGRGVWRGWDGFPTFTWFWVRKSPLRYILFYGNNLWKSRNLRVIFREEFMGTEMIIGEKFPRFGKIFTPDKIWTVNFMNIYREFRWCSILWTANICWNSFVLFKKRLAATIDTISIHHPPSSDCVEGCRFCRVDDRGWIIYWSQQMDMGL